MANEVRVLITAKDNASQTIKGVGDTAEKAGKAIALGLGAAVVGGLAGAVKAAANFEKTISSVGAVSGASADQLKLLGDAALRIGKDTQYGATEAAGAMEILAANGISVTDILGGAADAATTLAAAGGTSLAQAADTVSTAMAVWGAETTDLTDYVNRLAGAANVSRFGVEDMSQAIAQGGGVAAATGVDFKDFAASIAATATSFSSGSDAGTSFKAFLQRLAAPSKDAAQAMRELGINAFDSTGAMRPMGDIVQQLHDSLGRLSEAQRAEAAATIFGSDAMRTAMGLAGLTREEFEKLSQTMGDTSATDVAKQRMDNLAGAMEQLKGSLETIAIEVGMKLIPVLTDLAKWAGENLPKAFALLETEIRPKVDALREAFEYLRPAMDAAGQWFKDNPEVVRALAEALGLVTAGMVAFGVASLAASLVNPFTAILLGATALTAGIIYLIENWDDLRQRYEAIDNASENAVTAFEAVVDALIAVGEAERGAGTAIVDLINWFRDLPGNVQEALGDLGTLLYEGGQDMVQGMLDGVLSKWGELQDSVTSIPGNIVGAIKDAADGHSPWGITEPLGEDMIGGIIVGVEAAGPVLESAVNEVVGGAASTARFRLSQLLQDISTFVQQAIPAAIGGMPGFTGPTDPSNPGIHGPSIDQLRSMPPLRWGGAGGGSGGGGGSAEEAGRTAAEEFSAAFLAGIHASELEAQFGEVGANAILAFEEALTDSEAAAGIPSLISELIDRAEEEGVPNAAELGQNLANAIAEGLTTGSNEGVMAAMTAMNDAIVSAGTLTMDNLNAIIMEKAADRRMLDAIGSSGVAMMDALGDAITVGGRKNLEKLATAVDNIVAKLQDKAPEGQAAYLGTKIMTALQTAITENTPAATNALQSLLAQAKLIMDGGALDIKTGTIVAADAIRDMAKAFGVNGQLLIDNISVIVGSGLSSLTVALEKLPEDTRKTIQKILKELEEGRITVAQAIAQITGILPTNGTGSAGSGGNTPGLGGTSPISGAANIGDTQGGLQYQYMWNPVNSAWEPGWGYPGSGVLNPPNAAPASANNGFAPGGGGGGPITINLQVDGQTLATVVHNQNALAY